MESCLGTWDLRQTCVGDTCVGDPSIIVLLSSARVQARELIIRWCWWGITKAGNGRGVAVPYVMDIVCSIELTSTLYC